MKASNRKPLEIGYEIETIPYSRSEDRILFDAKILDIFHNNIWRRVIDGYFTEADDMLKTELLHMTTIMMHRCPAF